MRSRQKYVNFFLTAIAPGSAIFATQTSGSFDVLAKTVEGYVLPDGNYEAWAVMNYGNSVGRELFRIVSVSGKTVTWDKRISPNGAKNHPAGTSVQINDVAEILNYLAANADDFGSVETLTGLQVKVRGGQVTPTSAVADATLTLPDSSSGYVVWNAASRAFAYAATLTEPNDLVALASYTTALGLVTSMLDLRGPDPLLKRTGTGQRYLTDAGTYAGFAPVAPGSLVAGIDTATALAYDDDGLLTSFTADGKNYVLTYDPLDGELLTVTDGTNTWTAQYDADGNLSGTVKT